MSFYPRSGGLKKLRTAYNSSQGPPVHRMVPQYAQGYFGPPEHVRAESAVRMMRSGSSQTCYTEASEREELMLRDGYQSQVQSSYEAGVYPTTLQSQENFDSQGPGSQYSQGDSYGASQRLGERGDKSTSLRKLLPHLANWMQTSSAGKETEKKSQVEASSLETASQGELSTPTATEPCKLSQECKGAMDAIGQKCDNLHSLIESIQKDFKNFEATSSSRHEAGKSVIVDMQGQLGQQLGLINALVTGQIDLKDQLRNAVSTMLITFADEIAHMSEGLQHQISCAVQDAKNIFSHKEEKKRVGQHYDDDFGNMCFGLPQSTTVLPVQVKIETSQDLYESSNMDEARKLMERARRKRHRKGSN